jgi:hypothetical protein
MVQNYRLGLNNRFHPMHQDRPVPFDSKKPLLTVGQQSVGKTSLETAEGGVPNS